MGAGCEVLEAAVRAGNGAALPDQQRETRRGRHRAAPLKHPAAGAADTSAAATFALTGKLGPRQHNTNNTGQGISTSTRNIIKYMENIWSIGKC